MCSIQPGCRSFSNGYQTKPKYSGSNDLYKRLKILLYADDILLTLIDPTNGQWRKYRPGLCQAFSWIDRNTPTETAMLQ